MSSLLVYNKSEKWGERWEESSLKSLQGPLCTPDSPAWFYSSLLHPMPALTHGGSILPLGKIEGSFPKKLNWPPRKAWDLGMGTGASKESHPHTGIWKTWTFKPAYLWAHPTLKIWVHTVCPEWCLICRKSHPLSGSSYDTQQQESPGINITIKERPW